MEESFDKCLVNPFSFPPEKRELAFKRFFEKYPDIFKKNVKGSNGRLIHKGLALSFIVCTCDARSPFWELYQNEKIISSCRLLGIDKMVDAAGKLPLEIEEMLSGKIEEYNSMMIYYIKEQHIPEWGHLIFLWKRHNEEQKKLFTGDVDTKLKDDIDGWNKLYESIKELKQAMLANVEKVTIDKTFYRLLDSEVEAIFPEDIAKRKKDGKKSVDINPYKKENYD